MRTTNAAQAPHLTELEEELLDRVRALPSGGRAHVLEYVRLLHEQSSVRKPDPQAHGRLGMPGPPLWRMSPDEVAEMDAFSKSCDEASLGG